MTARDKNVGTCDVCCDGDAFIAEVIDGEAICFDCLEDEE